jgi:hypothetical protein
VAAQPRQLATAASRDVMPRYDTDRNLVLPDDYRRWGLIGSSLGLSYSEGGRDGHQMFNATPARHGRFATDVHMIEMAVKDPKRVPESWAYYAFGGPMMGGYRATAAPQPKATCFNRHTEHAARDNVFLQCIPGRPGRAVSAGLSIGW